MQSSLFTVLGGDSLEILPLLPEASVDSVVTDPPYELGFMGKAWDARGIAFSVSLWQEVLRVLKPGGHVLAFGGTRTYHRMTCAIEDAGFEVRDSLHWMYGTGFPKSLNVSVALDAQAGAERTVVGTLTRPRFSKGRGHPDGEYRGVNGGHQGTAQLDVTALSTDIAKQWDGWGTALKPGHEPIVLARKPLEGTVATNVAKWGVGGLNIDECRLPSGDACSTARKNSGGKGNGGIFGDSVKYDSESSSLGRWPANVLLDEDAAAELDAQSGAPRSGGGNGASRFFYVAKPSRKERDQGCEHLPAKSRGAATDRVDGSAGTENPRAGAGSAGGSRNYHPTVKPVDLMRYLVRLVTPAGGVVLDPFTGSGTTGMAALLEGLRFIGVEREPEYLPIALARMRSVL